MEHTAVKHGPGRLPMISVATVPKAYWDLSFPFESGGAGSIIMVGDALVASVKEALGTVFKVTRYDKMADFIALIKLEEIEFSSVVDGKSGETVFTLSFPVRFIDEYGNQISIMRLSDKASARMPEGKELATEEAARQFARLLSRIELDLAKQTRDAWMSGKFKM